MQPKQLTWGDPVPYAGWVYVRFRKDAYEVGVVFGEHDLECRVDHGCSRWLILEPEARSTSVALLEGLGFLDRGRVTLLRYPGGESAVHNLDLPEGAIYLQDQGSSQGRCLVPTRKRSHRNVW
jgi:hypothetical protein